MKVILLIRVKTRPESWVNHLNTICSLIGKEYCEIGLRGLSDVWTDGWTEGDGLKPHFIPPPYILIFWENLNQEGKARERKLKLLGRVHVRNIGFPKGFFPVSLFTYMVMGKRPYFYSRWGCFWGEIRFETEMEGKMCHESRDERASERAMARFHDFGCAGKYFGNELWRIFRSEKWDEKG